MCRCHPTLVFGLLSFVALLVSSDFQGASPIGFVTSILSVFHVKKPGDTFHSDASSLWIQLKVYYEAIYSSRSGLDHFRSRVCCMLIEFFCLACSGTSASVSGAPHLLSVENGIIMSLLSRSHRHNDQFNAFELPGGSCYYMSIGLIAYSRFWDIGWNCYESFWYKYDLKSALEMCVDTRVHPCRKNLNNGAVLMDRKVTRVSVIFLEGKAMTMSGVKLQVHQFWRLSIDQFSRNIRRQILRNQRVLKDSAVIWMAKQITGFYLPISRHVQI